MGAVIAAKSLAGDEPIWAKAFKQDLLQNQLRERPPLSQGIHKFHSILIFHLIKRT